MTRAPQRGSSGRDAVASLPPGEPLARTASIVAVGSELLGTDRLDTNSLRLCEMLERHGWRLVRKSVVGDDEPAIADELESAARVSELILVSGGLGPTEDDRTREGAARWAGRRLVLCQEVLSNLQESYRRRGRRMPETNRRQAQVIEGAEVLNNPRGTAPGLRIESAGATAFLFPGVPFELDGLSESALEPWLAERPGHRLERAEVRIACLPESLVEEMIRPAYLELGANSIAVLARPADVRVRWQAATADAVQRGGMLLRSLIGDSVYSEGEGLAEVVVGCLVQKGQTLAVAESCTGGGLGARITGVAGSSRVFLGGVISYSNELKADLLDVPESVLAEYGAVSAQAAIAMAKGVRARTRCDWSVAITGIAGPDGGSRDKPVGTVHLAVAGPSPARQERSGPTARSREKDSDRGLVGVRHFAIRLPGDRERVREQAIQFALELLRRELLGLPDLASQPQIASALGLLELV